MPASPTGPATGTPVPEPLWIAVRAWVEGFRSAEDDGDHPDDEVEADGDTTRPAAESAAGPEKRPPRVVKRRYPREALVFDTETLTEPGQRLMVGVWRLYRDQPGADAARTCIEEGLFYPDDLPARDPGGWQLLQAYAKDHPSDVSPGFGPELLLMSQTEWLRDRLNNYAHRHRNRCAIVGFNLPYDFGAVARYYGEAEDHFYGGFSLSFSRTVRKNGREVDTRFRPRLRYKAIDPRRTLFGWTSLGKDDVENWQTPGKFVDLRTLAFALTDQPYTLEGACKAFGVPYKKADVTYGVISTELLDYAREDVAHTAALYRACLDELDLHVGIDLQPHQLYSPAGVGAKYLQAMGVDKPLPRHFVGAAKTVAGAPAAADGATAYAGVLDATLLGQVMSAFYGGRAEARIVRAPMPVVVTDFTSMYPAQNALLDTWSLLIADQLTVEDATDAVRTLVADPKLVDRLFDPATWRDHIGCTYVALSDIGGAILPVRAAYRPAPDGTATAAGALNIGLNPLTYDGTLWYALPDLLAAALLGPAAFTISRAFRIRGRGTQPDLRPVLLRGVTPVDPRTDNPFVAMIGARHTAKNNPDLDDAERKRLDLFLKITANATSYGSLARFDRRDLVDPVRVHAHGPADQPVTSTVTAEEEPGPYCFPPVAASITAGARLMLALLESQLTALGGSYVFMDTDSAAIVATPGGGPVPCPGEPGGTLTALDHAAVKRLLARFTALNPFGETVVNPDPDLPGCPWKIEHESAARPLSAYAIAAKRYILYTPTPAGSGQLVQAADVDDTDLSGEDTGVGNDSDAADDSGLGFVNWSEHGLGLYLDPTAPDDPAREPEGRRVWMRQAWEYILGRALGTNPALPSWAGRLALTRFTVSSPRNLTWFNAPRHGPVSGGKPRPASFGLLAHANSVLTGGEAAPLPAAEYETDPTKWLGLDWRDRTTGEALTLATYDRSDPEQFALDRQAGKTIARTLGDILNTYPAHPEHKSLDPDGTPATARSRGKLRRRPVAGLPVMTRLVGKESNRLDDRQTGALLGESEYITDYGSVRDVWTTVILPVLADIDRRVIAAAVGVSPNTVTRWFTQRTIPHGGPSGHLQRARDLATEHATTQLRVSGLEPPRTWEACLSAYVSGLPDAATLADN